nr:cobalamin-binding protein [Natronospira proteinivora]
MERLVCLDRPAESIVTLSPGMAELMFEAGGGDAIVGTTSFSDYPEAAEDIPRIGSFKRLDLEAVLAREPDLIVAWITGNPTEQVLKLEEMGLPVYWGEQRDFDDVAATLRRFGVLAGSENIANARADEFESQLEALRDRYRDADPVEVFYQIWDDPIMTINGEHLISRAIGVCSGRTLFSDLERLTPRLDTESILAADPETIIAGGMGENDPSWLEYWEQYENMTAVRRDQLYFVPPSTLQRPTPRILDGIKQVCHHLDEVRERR